MAAKKSSVRTSELERWMKEQYRKSSHLKTRVDELVEEMSIEQDLIALRQERRLSQRALADLVGVTQPVIARIESGKIRNLELKTVVRIAAALGARVRILIEKQRTSVRRKTTKPAKEKLARTA